MAATATSTPASTSTSTANDDKTMGIIAHVLLIFTWWLGPLILWVIKKDQKGFAEHHAREALNFGITVTIAYIALWIVATILAFITFGFTFFLPFLVWIAALVFGILGAMAANKGELYRYPVSLRLVKG